MLSEEEIITQLIKHIRDEVLIDVEVKAAYIIDGQGKLYTSVLNPHYTDFTGLTPTLFECSAQAFTAMDKLMNQLAEGFRYFRIIGYGSDLTEVSLVGLGNKLILGFIGVNVRWEIYLMITNKFLMKLNDPRFPALS